MAITFLDEEEDKTTPEQERGTKITFLDEEPETGVTFLEEDPVQSYSSAVKEFKDVQKTHETNVTAYNEFSSLPLTEADEPERLRLYDGARNSEILLDDKLRKVEKLRPAYEAFQEQRKQEEIESLKKLSEKEEKLLLRDVLNVRSRVRMTGLGRVGIAEALGSVALGTQQNQSVADLANELGEEYANEILNRSVTPRDIARGAAARFVGGGILGIPSTVIDLLGPQPWEDVRRLQRIVDGGGASFIPQLEEAKKNLRNEALVTAIERMKPEDKFKIQRDYIEAKQNEILAGVPPERRQRVIDASERIMDSYEASRFNPESPKAYGALLPDGTIYFTAKGKEDVNLAIDKIAEAGLIPEVNKEKYKGYYSKREADRERDIRGAVVQTTTFQNWLKKNPEYSIETDEDVEEAITAFEESHNTLGANAVDIIVGPFRGIKSHVTGGTIGARLSAIAASDASESEKADQMLAIYAEESEKLEEQAPRSFVGGVTEITGNFAAQALPMLTAKLISLFGPTGKALGGAAMPVARAYTLAHMGALYAGQGYMEAVGQAVRESGYNSIEEIQEQNPELAERINETGKRAMIDAAKISLTEQIPIEGLVASIGKFAKKPTTFKRIMEAVALNPAAKISQEIFADSAMQAAQSRYSLENKDIKMMSLEEIGQIYLGVLPVTGGTAVAARTADRAMQRREDAIAKLNEEQRRIVEAESALIDIAERATKDAEATAPETSKAVAEQAAKAREDLNARIGQATEGVGGEPISIQPTVSQRREGETDQEWRTRTERERAERGATIPETRTIADAVRDKDTFVFNGMRGALVKDGGRVTFRPFGTQESYEVPASEAQNISEVEGIEWVRRGQARKIVQESPVEVSSIVEAAPVVTDVEADNNVDDVSVPPSLIEIEKSPTLNFFADLFDTGESKVSQEGKRAKKVSQTPEFYRQARPEQIDQARKLIDNALRIIDAMDVSDAEKDSLAQGFLLLDQDIDKYEQNKEYQRYRAEAIREVRPVVQAGEIQPTETEAQAADRELEQRTRAEAQRLEREAIGQRVARGEALFVPAGRAEALGRVARGESTADEFESLVEQGFAEEYKGQQVLTEAGIAALPEAQRPRLSPQVRKIQIDTGATDAAAEAISKNLRIGVEQVPFDVKMPEGWTLEGDIYVPPSPQQVTKATEPVTPTVEPSTPAVTPPTEVAPTPEVIPEAPTESARPPRRAAREEVGIEQLEEAPAELPALTIFDRIFAYVSDYVSANPEKEEDFRENVGLMVVRVNSASHNRSQEFRDVFIDYIGDRLLKAIQKNPNRMPWKLILQQSFIDTMRRRRFRGELGKVLSSFEQVARTGISLGEKIDSNQLTPTLVSGRNEINSVVESMSVLERAAISSKLLDENLIDTKDAYEYIQQATDDGFGIEQIRAAIDEAERKLDQLIQAKRGGRDIGKTGVVRPEKAQDETAIQQEERAGIIGEVLSELDRSENLTPNEAAARDKTNDPTINKIGSWRNTLPEGPLRDLIDLIISVSPDAANLDIKYVSTLDGRYDGLYYPKTNTIYMPLNPTKDINLLIGHELVHGTTLSKAREFDEGNLNALSANDRAVFNGLERIRQRLIKTMGRGNAKFAEIMRIRNTAERGMAAADAVANGEIDVDMYALVNMAEFLASSIDNDGFKDALARVDRNILNEIWDLIKRIFTLGGKMPNGVDLVWRSIAQLSTTVEGEGDVSAAAITPQQDREYLDAVERGDMETAQRMVDEAAKAAGYNSPKVFHGTQAKFNVFDDAKIGSANGRSEGSGFYFTTDETTASGYQRNGGNMVSAYLKINKPLDYNAKPFTALQVRKLLKAVAITEAKDSFEGNWKDGFLSNFGDTYSKSIDSVVSDSVRYFTAEDSALDQIGGIIGSGVDPATVNEALRSSLGYDAFFSKGFSGEGRNGGDIYVAMKSNQIKSADPVTRDDQGNIIPLSQRFQTTTPDIRFAAIDPTKLQKPDDMDSPTQADVSENVANRAEAKKAQLNILGHSILEDEIPEEYIELTSEDYENGMAFQDFKFSKAYNFNNPTYAPFIAAQWLRLNGGLMPTVKVQGLELSKPEKGTAEAESLRLLKRAISIYDSRSEVRGGKELAYSLGDIMATWMESGLGEAALRNAIVQFTNLDVSIAEKAAANFAEVYRLSQVVQDAKDRAITRVERGLPAETARQKKEKSARLKLEQAAGTIDAIAESIKIAFDINVNKPRTDRATERKQIEEQLRQAKRILRDIVPSQYLGGQLASLEAATGIDGLRKVVEAAQDALGNAMLDNAVARAKNAFIKATKAIKKNEIGPDAAAALREFVENYKTKGMSEDVRKKIQEAVAAFDANPVEALADMASERYRKRAVELDQIRIEKGLGLNALNEISDFVNSVLHADKIARGEMLFNKKQTRTEIINKSIEEIDKAKNISNSLLVKLFRITQGMRGEAILNALGLETLRKFAYENLVTDAYSDQLSNTHRLKHQIENAIKEITGFEIGSRDFDLYSKELIEVRGVNLSGESGNIKIQRNELWDILGSLRDPDNMRRAVRSGGFVINRLRKDNIDTVKITPDNYIDLLSKATEKDNAMIGFMHGMYNNELFELLNDSFVQAYGHGIKKVDSYYPRNADWVTRRVESKDDLEYATYMQTRVDDFGPSKERDERAKSRLVATDAISRIDYHLTNDARIAAYLPISKDIDSVLNDPMIKEKLTKKLGRKGYQIIVEMTRQQMVPARGLPSGILTTLSTNVGVGVLGLKIHAAMQNPVGIPIAVASYGMDGFKYLAKAIPFVVSAVDPAKWRKMAKVLGDFAPYYAERYGLGGYAREMTSSIVDVDYRSSTFRKSTEHAALFMLEKTDQWGSYIRYRIAQERIKDTTNLEEGTEEFNRAVAKEWSLIMFRSENTSHGADRTGVFQFAAKHPFAKFFIMFQSAVSKQFSLAAEGILQIQQGGAKNRREGIAKLGLFFTSVYMSAAISRAFYGFMFPPKDEEEEKKTWLEFFAGMIAAPASAIPVLGNFISTGIENIAAAASGRPEIGIRKPMQIDLVSSLVFSSLDSGIALGRFIADLSDQEINEITGNPKYVDSFLRLVQKVASPVSMLSGAPIGGGMQLWNLFITKPREALFAGDEAKRKETTKKIKDKIKAERPEPIKQEVAKLYFAAMNNNQNEFARAYKELKAKRKNFSLKDAREYISRREEFIISRLVESGDISIKDGDITREEYLENKAFRSATLSAVSQMWNDTRLKQAP